MPGQRNPDRTRMTVVIDNEIAEYMEKWARKESRPSKNNLAEALLVRAVETDKTDRKVLSDDEFSQIKRYLCLLGGKVERDGISFSVVAEALNIDEHMLQELHFLIEAVRNGSDLPPHHKFKVRIEKDVEVD